MISQLHARTMAQYNQWQNQSIYQSANILTDKQRREDKGAFFGSIHTTLAHVLWADRVWMNRFANTPPTIPEDQQGRGATYHDWEVLKESRAAFDFEIQEWAAGLEHAWLAADFTWSNTAGTVTSTQPAWRLVTHFFNHQTHHRGQVHALITTFGLSTKDTDLFLMPAKN